jgi:hypothetical protein
MLEEIEKIRDSMLAAAHDEHGRELALRAFVYARNRILDGTATTLNEAKHALAAFADGFCTGTHVATGVPCTRG